MMRTIFAGLAAVAASLSAQATPVFSEGFDDVSGLGAAGWVQTNNSAPVGATGWFQGNSGVFAAQSGSADSYIAANFLSAGAGGNVDNWLITPEIAFTTGDIISFFTRTPGAFPGDSLELLYSTGSTNLADFTSLLSIGADSYPTDWSEFSYVYGGPDSSVRLAFRYRVTDTSVSGEYIGIDSVVVQAVPEPGTLALLGAGLVLVPLVIRRKRVSGATVGVTGALAMAAVAGAASAAEPVTDPATLPKFEHVVIVNLAAKQPASAKKASAPTVQSGMRAYIDPVTKQLRQPTGEELAEQAAASKAALARNLKTAAVTDEIGADYSSAAVRRPDGSVSVKIGDELMSYEVAHVASDGSVTHECVGTQPNEKAALQAQRQEHSHEK